MTNAQRPVTVLFARHDSIYKRFRRVHVYDERRDALTWPGGTPIVAHPPCRSWSRLRSFAKPRPGERELALWAVQQVRQYGGVLEHPKGSLLWSEAALPRPGAGPDVHGGWSILVPQFWWGHRAEKLTLLYVVGCEPRAIPDIPLVLGRAPAIVSSMKRGKDHRPEITKREREATPRDFAKWLLELARRCEVKNATGHAA